MRAVVKAQAASVKGSLLAVQGDLGLSWSRLLLLLSSTLSKRLRVVASAVDG